MVTVVKSIVAVISIAAMMMVLPAFAQADSPICHNGVLSDDAGQGCADGLYEQVYGSGGEFVGSSSGICNNGILSDDAGQGCSDGLYEQVYGSGSVSSSSSSSTSSGGGGSWSGTAQCESGGNWSANTGNGYYGGLQFNSQTWDAYGNPAYSEASDAPASEQIAAANRVPYDAWPNC